MRLGDITVVRSRSLKEALSTLHDRPERVRPIAGGTDAIIQLKEGSLQTRELLDLSSIRELRYVLREGPTIRIGALSTYSDLIESSVLKSSCRMLVDACRTIGTPQIQNRATIGGNLANSSPAGDAIPPFYVLDATVTVQNRGGKRDIPVERFFLGYRETELRQDELITEISFEAINRPSDATFVKLGLREAHFISLVNVAVWGRWRPDGAGFSDVRVAFGAVAPTVMRAKKCEEFLRNRTLTEEIIWEAGQIADKESSPISDVRASADYRRAMIPALLYKAMHALIRRKTEWEKP